MGRSGCQRLPGARARPSRLQTSGAVRLEVEVSLIPCRAPDPKTPISFDVGLLGFGSFLLSAVARLVVPAFGRGKAGCSAL